MIIIIIIKIHKKKIIIIKDWLSIADFSNCLLLTLVLLMRHPLQTFSSAFDLLNVEKPLPILVFKARFLLAGCSCGLYTCHQCIILTLLFCMLINSRVESRNSWPDLPLQWRALLRRIIYVSRCDNKTWHHGLMICIETTS